VSAAPFRAPDGITPIRAIRAWGYAFDGALGRLHPIGRMGDGYRAELARVVELIPCWGQETTVRRLAMCLGVAVGRPIFHWPPSDSDPSRPRLPMASWVREPAVEHRARAAAHVAA
jgi:hypothetical protein